MKKVFINAAIALMITASFSSCLVKPPDFISWDGLMGTQWKLRYIHDMTGELPEQILLESLDCDTCYTLTFDADKKWHISGVSILNTLSIEFSSFYKPPEMNITVTDMDEPFDGNLYCSLLRSVFEINSNVESALILFVKDKDTGSWPHTHTLTYERINP